MQQAMLNKSRADKFLLVFDVPPILKEFSKKFNQTNTTIIPDSVQYSIFGTAVPEITVPAVENRFAGNTLYVSSHSKNPYPPVSVSFNVDNEYKNYWVIYQWLNLKGDIMKGKLIQVTRLFRTIKQILQFTVRMNLITIE